MKKQLHTAILILLLTITSQAQTWQWGKRGGSTDNLAASGSTRIEEVITMVTDSQKNIYVLSPVGQMLLNIDGNPKTNYGDSSSKTDFALSSFSCDGTYRWSKIIGGGGYERLNDIQIDSQDNIYISGRFSSCTSPYYARIDSDVILNTYTSASCKTLFIAKYSNSGNLLWFKQPQSLVDQTIAIGQTGHRGLGVDAVGNCYWLVSIPSGTYADGAFVNSMSGSNLFILKYDANGNFINAIYLDIQLSGTPFSLGVKFYRNPNTGYFYITSVDDGGGGSAAVVGGQTITHSAFIACFNELGQFQWKKESTGTTGGGLKFYNLLFDNSNNIYLSGEMVGTLGAIFGYSTTDWTSFVLKTDSTADNLLWGTSYSNNNGAYTYGAIALNGNEVGYAGYCFGNNFTWGSQSIFASNDNEGTEVLLARFNKNTGACLGLHKIPGNVGYDDYGTALTVDASGDYILGGGFGNQLTISGNTLQNAGSQTDFFLAKFATSACSPLSNEEFNVNEIKVYPNPVKDNLYWQGETGWTNYEVYSLLGQKVAEGKIEVGQNQININHLTKGIYLLKCSDNSGNGKDFKVVKE